MDCLHYIGAIPSFQTAMHTLHISSTPASPAAFIISMFIPSIPGAFPVFADFSDSSTSDRSISSSCSRMACRPTAGSRCFSCLHLDLVTLQSSLPISV